MASTHVIRRQLFDVELVGTEADGLDLQRRLPDLAHDSLNPALEKVFERMVPANEHWVIDTLLVDAGTVAAGDLERALVEAVSNALERCLLEGVPSGPSNSSPNPIVARTGAESIVAAFVYFLRTGVLPWWFSLPRGKTLEECLRDLWRAGVEPAATAGHIARQMLPAIRGLWPRMRLVRQFSADILATLLRGLSVPAERAVQAVLAKLGEGDVGGPRKFSEHLWERAFAGAIRDEAVSEELLVVAAFEAWVSEARQPDPAITIAIEMRIAKLWPGLPTVSRPAAKPARAGERLRRDDSSSQLELEEGVFIGCAGAVLLHPFLPRLFEVLGIAREGELHEPERALALIHFLTTGLREAPEHDLLLAKLLCNIPLETPVPSRFELSAADEDEAGAVLAAVIRHWDALGETSVDGLRGSFFVRPGKLSRRGESDVLQVESRAYDVLLDRLPWGLSLVQLPWMQKPLWVEWRF